MRPSPRKKTSPAPLLRKAEARSLTRAERAADTTYAAVMRAVGIALVVAPLGLVAACAHEARPPGAIAPIDPVPLGGAPPAIQPTTMPSGSTTPTPTPTQTQGNGQTPPCPHGPGNEAT